jgi:hypothetical protein
MRSRSKSDRDWGKQNPARHLLFLKDIWRTSYERREKSCYKELHEALAKVGGQDGHVSEFGTPRKEIYDIGFDVRTYIPSYDDDVDLFSESITNYIALLYVLEQLSVEGVEATPRVVHDWKKRLIEGKDS